MGLDEGVDLVVGKHNVDALALEARVHPVVIPPGIEQVTGCLAFHALDLDEAGVAARVVGMDAVFLGDGPRLVDLVRQEVRPSSNVPLPTPLPLPKGAQLKVYWSTSSPPAPVTSFIKMPLSNQLVSEMLVTLTDLHTPMSAVPRFTSGRKALRSGEYEYRPMEPSTPAPTPSAAPFMNSRLSISSLLLNQSESCARQGQQGHDGEVGDHAHDEADDHAGQHGGVPCGVGGQMALLGGEVLGGLEFAPPATS